MNILVSGAGGVRTDFVQQYLIRILNPHLQQSWNIDSYTGRTIQNLKPNNYTGEYIVYKEHSGLRRISDSEYILSRRENIVAEYDKVFYLLHNHQDIEECTKRAWEHVVKSYMYNSAENYTGAEIHAKIDHESEISLHGNDNISVLGVSILRFADIISDHGWQSLQEAMEVDFPVHAAHLWQTALTHSHSPDKVYYRGELFTKDHVRQRVEYYYARKQEYYGEN